jgi:diacylglycerol O-acyltransferase / wax synthase
VPGPPVPLYLAGAKFLSFHPLSIIVHGLALNITIQTYAGHVDFGIVADKKALPHANDLAKAIEAAFKEAQTVFSSPAEAVVLTGKTPSGRVPEATKSVKLEKPLSTRRRSRRDTGLVTHNE